MASAPENKEHETVANAVLERIWASDNKLMATPAAVPADLGLKAHYLAAQLKEFEQLERRHCESLVADLQALFPQPTAAEPNQDGPDVAGGAASPAESETPEPDAPEIAAGIITGKAEPSSAAGMTEEQADGQGTMRQVYSQWLAARARLADETDASAEANDREEELVRAAMATPAATAHDVFRKLEILEHYVAFEGEPTDWCDSREVILLASIRADLTRLRPGEPLRRR